MNLKLTRSIGLASIGSLLLLLPIVVFGVGEDGTATETQPAVQTTVGEGMSEDDIHYRARLISVRVSAVHKQEWDNNGLFLDTSGSGIVIGRKFIKKNPTALYRYLVLTNAHVAKKSNENGVEGACRFRVETREELIHTACQHPEANFEGTDLSLLYFYSPYEYQEAKISQARGNLKPGDKVFVAGFPCDLASIRTKCPSRENFKFIPGEVKKILEKPLVDGYQIGYTNEVIEGTSGGPILNNQGEVVGINGRREGGNESTYTYQDGSKANRSEIEQMRQLRWGIPIDEYLKQDKNKLLETTPLHPERFQQIRYYNSDKPDVGDPKFDKREDKKLPAIKDVEPPTDRWNKLNPQIIIAFLAGVLVTRIIELVISQITKAKPSKTINGSENKTSGLPPEEEIVARVRIESQENQGVIEIETKGLKTVIYMKIPESEKIDPQAASEDRNYQFERIENENELVLKRIRKEGGESCRSEV